MTTQTVSRTYKQTSTGESFTVEVEIDLDKVAFPLACRAIESKSGKSTALDGGVKCRVVARRAAQTSGH